MSPVSKYLIFCLTLFCSSCSIFQNDMEDKEEALIYPSSIQKERTLLTRGEFQEEIIAPGLTYYSFEGYDQVSSAFQMVYVIELDLYSEEYYLDFEYVNPEDSLSSVMLRNEGIAGINATYESESVFLKVDGMVYSEVDWEPDHIMFWKHDGVIFGEGRKIGIAYGGQDRQKSIQLYSDMSVKNIFAGSPMLIDDYEPVGETFVPSDYTLEELNGFEYEDYRRHQGLRHPRTAVALTDDNDLLLIVVDGRRPGKAEGMNAKELTMFLKKHFAVRWALNMDGGGSSTMCIKGKGAPNTNVVNFPTDNNREDHYGQRSVCTHLIVKTAG